MARAGFLDRSLLLTGKGTLKSLRLPGPPDTWVFSRDSLAGCNRRPQVPQKHGRSSVSQRKSDLSLKSFCLLPDKLQNPSPLEVQTPFGALLASVSRSSCLETVSSRKRAELFSKFGALRRKHKGNKGHVSAPAHSNRESAKTPQEDSHRKGHRGAPTVLYSVAALPSLTTALYPSLASSNFAVHLEFSVLDLGVAVLTAAAALLWVRLFDELARRNVFERKLSRKLVHISSGLLFMLFWPVFSSDPSSRWFAALVPATNLLRLAAVGTGVVTNEDTVKAISRDGDRSELLRGPLYYVMVLIAATVCFWRQSPIGVSALALMCAGDGIADIVGRRFGRSLKLPYNKSKSWAGSLAMFLTGTVTALLYVAYFCQFGFYECNMMHTALKVATIALAATIVESLPITDTLDDNVTVPLTCVAVGSLLFPA